jgi:type II restriction enzyme
MALTANKGEWSELYALFKLLGDQHLALGQDKLEKIQGIIYPIIQVLREESNGTFAYTIEQNLVIITENGTLVDRVPVQTFRDKAIQLFGAIKTHNGTFAIPEIEDFMSDIHCASIKARSSQKSDITIIIHDPKTNQRPTLGFSIKSQIGHPSTLLNAGKTTNFTYKITGTKLSAHDIQAINSINTRYKIKDRIAKIIEKGGVFSFIKTEREIFSNNLILIDSLLPHIVAQMVYTFYSSDLSKVADLVSSIETENAMGFNTSQGHQFYDYKIKRFLTDISLGMMPSIVWTGTYDVTGGYLLVKDDGEVLCYHLYNKNEFEHYLMHNTKLETASSSRHGFGFLFEEDDVLYMNLNLQIRFIK